MATAEGPIVPREAKTIRFRRHIEKILAGRVRVPRGASFVEKFVRELVKFPHGRDDQVDAMTQILDWLERHKEIDFSKSNVTQSGLAVSTREPDDRVSLTRTPLSPSGQQNPPGRAVCVLARPQPYNPPFAEVKAWVTY